LIVDFAVPDRILDRVLVTTPAEPMEPDVSEPVHSMRTKLIVSGVLAAVVIVAVITMVAGEHDATRHQPEAATAIGMVPALAVEKAGPTRTMAIYVWNGEGRKTTFTIKIIAAGTAARSLSATVFDASQWSARVSVPSTGKVTAELFRPGDTLPYRMVFEAPQDQS
jgi:hypothetical protein